MAIRRRSSVNAGLNSGRNYFQFSRSNSSADFQCWQISDEVCLVASDD